MKVAIVGSRDYPNMQDVLRYVAALPADTVIVSGGARGVDTVAEMAAKARGLGVEVYRAEWQKYGNSAGMKRNVLIVAAADSVVAFWDGASHGTAHSINLARRMKKPTTVFTPEASE